MKYLTTVMAAVVFVSLGFVSRAQEEQKTLPMEAPVKSTIDTAEMGGVPVPTTEVLKEMYRGQYILHARKGKLTKVPVEKVLLPHDPEAHPQTIQAVLAPDGTVYAGLASIMAKSTDGGRTWSSHACGLIRGLQADIIFQILSDGTFIGLRGSGKMDVVTSKDEGRTWQKISELNLPSNWDGGRFNWMSRFADDTLVVSIHVWEDLRNIGRKDGRVVIGDGDVWAGKVEYLTWRSTDMGQTWQGPSDLNGAGGEGGAVQTPSGRIFASVRHQPLKGIHESGGKFKNVFLINSDDQGETWYGIRPLTTVPGQAHGVPVALSDGTVIVVHETRYGPGGPGSRAMISYDEGDTWEDEVYYMDYTIFTGSYSSSVALEDGTVLTIVGSSQVAKGFADVVGNTDFYAIRWKLAEKNPPDIKGSGRK